MTNVASQFCVFYQPSRCINNIAVPDTVTSPEFTVGASLKSTTTSHTSYLVALLPLSIRMLQVDI